MPVSVGCTCLAAIFGAYVLWDAVPRPVLLAWITAVVVLTGLRLVEWAAAPARALLAAPARARRWIRQMQAGALCSGALWGGITVVVMLRAGPELRATMLLSAVLLTVASCFSYGARISVFLLFFLPAVVPGVPALYALGDRVNQGFSGGLALFIVVMVVSGLRFNDLFMQYLLLSLRNEALAAQWRQERDAAEAATLAKSRALAATGHDLRQPVHAIGLSVTTLRRHAQITPELAAVATHLEETIASLWRLLDTLADISRLNARLVRVNLERVLLETELRRAVTVMTPAAGARGLAIRQVPTSAVVRTDPKILNTVLLNLLGNAVRYTRAGRIVVGCRRQGAKALVLVCDTGIGFSPEDQARVFSEFTRGRYVEGAGGDGLGLGLAIVRQSLRLLGEDVRIVATSERGSILGFTLPLVR